MFRQRPLPTNHGVFPLPGCDRDKVAAKGKGEIDMYFIKNNYKQGFARGATINP